MDWDVPVQLVPYRSESGADDAGRRRTVRVDPGPSAAAALPGIVAIEVTTVDDGGRMLLEAIDLCTAGAVEAITFATLLADLAEDGEILVAVHGTPFTSAVLAALTRVPAGQRCSYTELAVAAGRSRAVRAAASVVARNRVPLVLPCHRVVPTGGGTGRYAWGEAVKAALLAAEAAEELRR